MDVFGNNYCPGATYLEIRMSGVFQPGPGLENSLSELPAVRGRIAAERSGHATRKPAPAGGPESVWKIDYCWVSSANFQLF